ncbi:MAG: isochorismate synthase [Kofleriaceae bacterium]
MKPDATYLTRSDALSLAVRSARPDAEFVHALEAARADEGLTFIATRAPVAPPHALVAAAVDCAVAWTAPSRDADGRALTIAGIGVARELRGNGPERWQQVIDGARALRIAQSTEGLARPRFLGGGAFAPGAADRGPWTGFGDAWFVLPRWTYVHDQQHAWLVLAVDEVEARDADRWTTELAAHRAALGSKFVPAPQPVALEITRASPELWRAQVEAITGAIADGAYAKIVAARTCTVAHGGAVRAADLLAALDDRHGDCVRVLVRPPNAGALVAATPERLVRRIGDTVLCDALAGTVRTDVAGSAEALLASAKDRREHAHVVDAIREALAGLGMQVAAPAEPVVRQLRHMLHLHTPFRATGERPPHVLELARRLHPTPAVGGTPTGHAIDWIRRHEPVERGWYASPVGWFDLDGNGELAVAIRSGVLAGNRAHLWAGAGIVAGSDPDRELAETELKFRAMLGALGDDR